MLEIKLEVISEVLVIHLSGRLDGITSSTLAEKIQSPAYETYSRIVLNCAELQYISSEGLRVILVKAKSAKADGGALTLCSLNTTVNEVMTISGFGSMLGVHADIDHALNALN
jgi:anti-sigma B factor antagonist